MLKIFEMLIIIPKCILILIHKLFKTLFQPHDKNDDVLTP